MLEYLWLVPALPLFSSMVLAIAGKPFSKVIISTFAVGSVGLSALLTLAIYSEFIPGSPFEQHLWQWIPLENSSFVAVRFYLDSLSLLMLAVVTGVGFLIHWYAAAYMRKDKDYRRFFVYLNLFVAAMLILVLSDNLVLLYLGWEGVGLCSFLLIGFWYDKPANVMAAKKAFIVTRVGDAAMLIGLLILFSHLNTLDIQAVLTASTTLDSASLYLICLLLLLGAAGKSAQFPLHTWLPDAMAGPSPVSALIHAATMVTAGVYLIARLHPLFLQSSDAMNMVAIVGATTLLISALSALAQTDVKRILAYSTISQIGYMFLALGAGGWNPAVFHLMTHAFFKALLFLVIGSLIIKCHHQQHLYQMRGQLRKFPITAGLLTIGLLALVALPGTAGFFSKEAILEQVFIASSAGPILWWVAILGALLTAMYSTRLLLVLWSKDSQFNEHQAEEKATDFKLSSHYVLPLLPLAVLAIFGGWWALSLPVFPSEHSTAYPDWAHYLALLIPWLGIIIAWFIYRSGQVEEQPQGLQHWLYSGLGFDRLYHLLLVTPFVRLARLNKKDLFELPVVLVSTLTLWMHELSSLTQTGKLRWYAAAIACGLVTLVAIQLIQGDQL